MPEESEKGTILRDGAMAIVLSSVMYYVGLTNLFFVCPLLRFSASHTRKHYIYLALAELGFVVGYSFYLCNGSETFVFGMALNLIIPLSLLAAGTIWLFASKLKWQKRLFLSFLPAVLLIAALAVYLYLDRALFDLVYSKYENVFADLLSSMFAVSLQGMESKTLFEILAITVGTMTLPVILAAVCASCFYYENSLHSKEGGIDEKVLGIEFDQNLIWFFLLFFAFFIATYFVSLPEVLDIAVSSLFISMLLVYAIQGFSVVYAWIRRVGDTIRSGSVFAILAFVGVMVPGINMIVLIGLPILGVLENFFNLKIRSTK